MKKWATVISLILLPLLIQAQGLINNGTTVKITNGTNFVISDASDGDLTITGGTIANYGDLYIESDINNDGMLINGSDATGDGRISFTGTTTGSGSHVAERYYASQSNDGSKPDGRWWYISPSVSGAVSDSILNTDYPRLWRFEESSDSWQQITGSASLNVMQGYATRVGSNQTVQYAGGIFNTGNQSIGITNSTRGWNLVGNPYPTTLDIESVYANGLHTATFDESIWVRTNLVYATYNTTSDIGTNGGTQYISSMQGFYVWCSLGGSFTVEEADRSMQSVSLLKSASLRSLVMFSATRDSLEDEVALAMMAGAEDQFEHYDTRKLFGSNSIELFLELDGGDQLAVNVLSDSLKDGNHKLGIKVAEEGTYTIRVRQFINIPGHLDIYLDDLYEGKSVQLMEDSEYTFESGAVTTSDRFRITFQVDETVQIGDPKEPERADPQIYSHLDRIYLRTGHFGRGAVQVTVLNLLGKQVKTLEFQGTGFYTFPVEAEPGIYIVQMRAKGEQFSQKIVLTFGP
jgi:hypothetical protein